MAKKPDAKAAKARKQKVILIVGGVALLALGALQGPKLLKQGGSSATEAATTSTTETSSNGTVSTAAPAGVIVVSPTADPSAGTSPGTVAVASLAGVQIRSAGAPAVDEGQLWSFSIFAVKDPFVPQAVETTEQTGSGDERPPADTTATETEPVETAPVETKPVETVPVETKPVETAPVETAPVETTPVETRPVETTPVETAPVETTPAPPTETTATVPVVPPKPLFATVELNGAAQYLAPGDAFPKLSPVFVLVGLKEDTARIGVAGGSFADGEVAGLKLGKSLTAVDRATGVRYVLKLVYLGQEPEVVEAFDSGSEKQPAASGK